MNAEMLRKRRRRYSGKLTEGFLPRTVTDSVAFLWIFIGMLMIMAYHLFVLPPQVSNTGPRAVKVSTDRSESSSTTRIASIIDCRVHDLGPIFCERNVRGEDTLRTQVSPNALVLHDNVMYISQAVDRTD